ncbi:YodC family protein [Segnochrobactraceae bacterium EtOH-i3]
MTVAPFKVGDIVTLRSGGPDMTVVYIEPEVIHFAWFVDGELKTSNLPGGALEHYPDRYISTANKSVTAPPRSVMSNQLDDDIPF